jgi:hypothetical protein
MWLAALSRMSVKATWSLAAVSGCRRLAQYRVAAS